MYRPEQKVIMKMQGYIHDPDHKYIIAERPKLGTISEAAYILTEQYFPNCKTKARWKKEIQRYILYWDDPKKQPRESLAVNFRDFTRYLKEHGHFDVNAFQIKGIICFWLDVSLDMQMYSHKLDETQQKPYNPIEDTVAQQQYGQRFPIKTRVIREGQSFTSFLPHLTERIIALRNNLIINSNKALEPDWFFDFRTLINDTISLVEITLTQLYIKAEYDPLPSWTFDKNKLGERFGRRLVDKLKWVHDISGNPLNAEQFVDSFNKLRELRNHMLHFDPPTFVAPIEEITIWLNQVVDVGWLLIRIRQAIGAEVSIILINFIMQPEVIWVHGGF